MIPYFHYLWRYGLTLGLWMLPVRAILARWSIRPSICRRDIRFSTSALCMAPITSANFWHALALCWQKGLHNKTIYSDSYNAILWVSKGKCKTALERTPKTEPLFQIIARAENWLKTHQYRNPIIKWETKQWGEVPADFGRK